MLTVEYRVNGQLIGYTSIHNVAYLPEGEYVKDTLCRYEYKHVMDYMKSLNFRTVNSTTHGTVIHDQHDGPEALVKKVLDKIV